jgi:hypothetical protein
MQLYLRKMISKGHAHVSEVLRGMVVRCSNSMQLLRLVVGVGGRESYDTPSSAPERETLERLDAWEAAWFCRERESQLMFRKPSDRLLLQFRHCTPWQGLCPGATTLF